MKEKERYELKIYAGCEYYSITDTKEKQQITIENTINLLNQQDKRIKELENMNSRLSQGIYWGNGEHFCDVVKRYKSENEQLKQSQNKKAIEELEGLQVQCQFSITFADYKQEQMLYDYINDRIKELKGEKE